MKFYLKHSNNEIIRMSVPILIQMFFQILFGMIDTMALSRYSDYSVAAVGYANQINSIFLLSFIILSSGVSILISQYIGAKKENEANTTAGMAILLSIIIGIISSLIICIFSELILRFLNVPYNLLEDAANYLHIIGYGITFQAIYNVFTAIYRAYSKAKYATIVSIIVNIFNIIGDGLVVVDPFKANYDPVKGVAYITVLAYISGVFVMCLIANKELPKITFSVNIKIIKNIFSYGIPAAGENISYKFSQLTATSIIMVLGSDFLSAKTYAMNIMTFISIVPNSIATAIGILVGYYIGKKQVMEAYKICYKGLKFGLVCVMILNVFVLCIGNILLDILIDSISILHIARIIMLFENVTLLAKTCNFMFGNSLRGTGDVVFPVAVSVVSMWGLGVIFAYILGIKLKWGILGIYIAFLLDETFRSVLLFVRWKSKKWKNKGIIY